jgi:hypothetical protein
MAFSDTNPNTTSSAPPTSPGFGFTKSAQVAPSALSGYNTAYQQLLKQQQSLGSNATADLHNRLNAVGTQFTQLWTNLVGRAPTPDELDAFYSTNAGNIIANSANGTARSETDPTNVRNQIAQYVGDTGQRAAQDYATQQLEAQQAKANELADLFRTQGRKAISDTEAGLLDYQNRLFERLRPNLLTSLQAQGLLNTGGMNEAFAGKAKDLSDQGQQFLLQAQLDNENQANAIAYGGASAPYMFKQSNIMNQPNMLMQSGQNALNANTNTFMSNLDYTHQLGLLAQQNKYMQENQPSFLRTFGQTAATSLGNNFSIPQWIAASNSGAKSSVAGAA